MKITWFGNRTFRIQIAGQILVIDPARAPQGIDAAELVSGADRVLAFADSELPLFDTGKWQPPTRRSLLDDAKIPQVQAYRLQDFGLRIAEGASIVLVDAHHAQPWGRWADGAAVVLIGAGDGCAAQGRALLEAARPRLIALATGEDDLDAAFDGLRGALETTPLIALEPGLAVEV